MKNSKPGAARGGLERAERGVPPGRCSATSSPPGGVPPSSRCGLRPRPPVASRTSGPRRGRRPRPPPRRRGTPGALSRSPRASHSADRTGAPVGDDGGEEVGVGRIKGGRKRRGALLRRLGSPQKAGERGKGRESGPETGGCRAAAAAGLPA